MEPTQPKQPIMGQLIPPTPVQPQQGTKTTPTLVGLGVVALLVVAGGVWWMSQKTIFTRYWMQNFLCLV